MNIVKCLCSAFLISLSSVSYAETSVIISAQNPNEKIDQVNIKRIFLGKTKRFPDGGRALPIDQFNGSARREDFNNKILNKSASQLRSYWSRLIFTGKGTPPKQSGNDAAVKKLVANDPSIIGYIDSAAVDSSVKVVLEF